MMLVYNYSFGYTNKTRVTLYDKEKYLETHNNFKFLYNFLVYTKSIGIKINWMLNYFFAKICFYINELLSRLESIKTNRQVIKLEKKEYFKSFSSDNLLT